jgi:hypothetical protein
MEVLPRCSAVGYPDVAFRREVEEAGHASAGVLRTLALIAVGKQ